MVKTLKKIGAFALTAAILLTVATGCKPKNPDDGIGEEINEKQTQLYVGNFNKGYGDEWLYALKKRFETFYKDVEFESGKKGVQVVVDNILLTGPEYIDAVKKSQNAVIFNELVYYNSYVNEGVAADITDVVKGDLSVYGDSGTIENKLSGQHKQFYTAKDGKYYGIPHYSAYTGIVYDVDLFDQKGYYLAYDKNNGNDGFIKKADDKRSYGPDGKTGVLGGTDYSLDDGLPATYDEYFRLCDYIKSSGQIPVIWTGTYHSDYLGYLLRSLATDYEGKEQMLLNYTFDGSAKNLVESIGADGTVKTRQPVAINNKNGYELYTSAGRYHALDFLQRLIYKNGNNSLYWYDNGFTGGMTHIEAQDTYLTSVYENDRIAMLYDGIWWEGEANATFTNMSAGDASMSRNNRRFGFMPMPKATEDEVGTKNTMLDTLYSMCFINSNVSNNPVVLDLAKKFLMFANTQQSLEEFNVITSTPKALDYEVSEENMAKMSYFGRSVRELAKRSDIVYPISVNALYLNNQGFFEYASTFKTLVDGKVYSDIGKAMYDYKYTAKQMFEGIAAQNGKTTWESTFGKYF